MPLGTVPALTDAPGGRSMSDIARWIAVLPGAFVAGGLARVAVSVLREIQGRVSYFDMPDGLVEFGNGCMMGAAGVLAAVYGAAAIAPRWNNAVGGVLAACIFLFNLVLLAIGVPAAMDSAAPIAFGELGDAVARCIVAGSLVVAAGRRV